MILPVSLRVEAQVEFDEAFDWYEQQQSGLGLDFLNCVTALIEQISLIPESCEVVFQDIRRAVVQKYPYSILYYLETEQIVVIAVFHSKRNPKIWQKRII
jgi:plasmid stabilization system protein ParE